MTVRTQQEQFLSNISTNTEDALTPGSTVYIDDTVQHTGPFFAIIALSDAVVDVSECTTNIIEGDGASAMRATTTNFTIPSGVTIYGNFTSIELDSGTALAYAKSGITVTTD